MRNPVFVLLLVLVFLLDQSRMSSYLAEYGYDTVYTNHSFTLLEFVGNPGYNYTGASAGGLEISNDAYLFAGN